MRKTNKKAQRKDLGWFVLFVFLLLCFLCSLPLIFLPQCYWFKG
jgi:hypothetical protein